MLLTDSCGEVLEALETFQVLRQPKYAADRICTWTIRAPSDHKVLISSIHIFRQTWQERNKTGNQLFVS